MVVDTLALLVAQRPGATAAELSADLQAVGHDAPEPIVHRLLCAAHGRFRCDDSSPPRWWPATVDLTEHRRGVAPVEVAPSRAGGAWSGLMPLYPWQEEALGAWVGRGRRGVVEAVTGTGKTMVGVAAVLEQLRARGQALILVPTTELQRQWTGVLSASLPPETRIGRLGDGGTGSLTTHDVIVAIVNTLRSGDARPIRPKGLLVADECHRYASAFNRLALDSRFDRRLGLSATYARDDDGHLAWLDPYFGGSCYQLGYRRAISDGVAARVVVALIGVPFEAYEQDRYDSVSEAIGGLWTRLTQRYGVACEPYSVFMREVNALADRSRSDEAARLARQYRLAVTDRRQLLAEATGKRDALDALVPAIRRADRVIVFTQSIAASEDVAGRLCQRGVSAGAIHSGLAMAARRRVLQTFASGGISVVSAPRVLDEGIDVPAADLAVIVGASRSHRQMIQRMGRVLRRKADGRPARFAVLFIEGTVEDPAAGAHEGFLEAVVDVADAVQRFSPDAAAPDVNDFLSPVVMGHDPMSPGAHLGRLTHRSLAALPLGASPSDTRRKRSRSRRLVSAMTRPSDPQAVLVASEGRARPTR
jgi:superfamily II DNA or RNA helicase